MQLTSTIRIILTPPTNGLQILTAGRQMCNQAAALQQTYCVERSSFFYLSAVML